MLFELRKTLFRQFIALLVFTLISAFICHVYDFYPRLRLNFLNLWWGLAWGLIIALLMILLNIFALKITPRRHFPSLIELSKSAANFDIFTAIGAALLAASGEELLFRGTIVHLLAYQSISISLLVNLLIVLAINYQGSRHLVTWILSGLEGSIYALLYCVYDSMFLLALAHGVCLILSWAWMRNARIISFLEKELINKRTLHELIFGRLHSSVGTTV